MNFRDTVGHERDAIPAANVSPAATHSIIQVAKALLERLGNAPGDPLAVSILNALVGDDTATWADSSAAQRCLLDMPYVSAQLTAAPKAVVGQASQRAATLSLQNLRTDSDLIQTTEFASTTIHIDRFRPGAGLTADIVSTSMTEVAGMATYDYTFPATDWQDGDLYLVSVDSCVVTIAGQAFQVPELTSWGIVIGGLATIDDAYDALASELVLKQAFYTGDCADTAEATVAALDALAGPMKDIKATIYVDGATAGNITPIWYVTSVHAPLTFTQALAPAPAAQAPAAAACLGSYEFGDLAEGLQLELRLDSAGNDAGIDYYVEMTHVGRL